MISVSRFTKSPSLRFFKMVWLTVCGMAEMENSLSPTSATVRLMPSMVMEPFSTIYRISSAFACMVYQMAVSSRRTRITFPTPSTWPATICPPKRPSAAMALSRFTGVPIVSPAREERFSVSCITSAEKPCENSSVTVKQMPLTAMLSPILVPSKTVSA